MKLTGPDAMPPPVILALLLRIVDRLTPAPEPYLNSMASVLARSMIEPMLSWTELMKHAEHCGFASIPTLNQTGELNAIFWWTSRCVSSAWKAARSSSLAKESWVSAHAVMLLASLSMSWWNEFSRSGVPMWPRKYLLTTTFVASCDQKVGTSTSFCSKTLLPVSELMPAVRYSQVISS